MKKAFLVTIIGLVLVSCEERLQFHKQKEMATLDADSLQREQSRYTILDDAELAHILSEQDIAMMWAPTEEQVGHILSLVRDSVSANEDSHARYLKADSLNSAYKQLICFVDSKGDSLVFINGLCAIGDYPMEDAKGKLRFYRQDWQNRLITLSDGGDCYWRALINFSKKKVEWLYANGSA